MTSTINNIASSMTRDLVNSMIRNIAGRI
jgi:hypothetical protein